MCVCAAKQQESNSKSHTTKNRRGREYNSMGVSWSSKDFPLSFCVLLVLFVLWLAITHNNQIGTRFLSVPLHIFGKYRQK